MSTLPLALATVSGAFAPLFARRVVAHVQRRMVSAILAPGTRPITSVWRVMGRRDEQPFQNDHRVRNRAQWWPLEARHRLVGLRLDAFGPEGPVVMGRDETIERRRGEQMAATGISRDPGRSSHPPASTPGGYAGSMAAWRATVRLQQAPSKAPTPSAASRQPSGEDDRTGR
jgi:hypothetical protein